MFFFGFLKSIKKKVENKMEKMNPAFSFEKLELCDFGFLSAVTEGLIKVV